jgi:hypothetical protein
MRETGRHVGPDRKATHDDHQRTPLAIDQQLCPGFGDPLGSAGDGSSGGCHAVDGVTDGTVGLL